MKTANNRFGVILSLVIGVPCVGMVQQNTFAAPCPCDIYATGGTPCVAAHSMVRALYESYNGPLYQVRRTSDKVTKDIGVLTHGRIRQCGCSGLVFGRQAGYHLDYL